ncbi:cell division protein DivIVA [Actinoplanes sp. SE50]|uniref:DivIVA domain-containing protein n=1 Tax=unclassified Actinoplanes TaxID=2626549 RepID=UPI00023EC08B|nr:MULTISPECIES: DivIVA domain-containing protein [unclassified Actinoplanes]AEV82989.1 Laminin subunit beta-2 [Actinoplanes sp. SE50/110]ATO81385.1 cell division protein DivIVA [Actinoplanes sp. SE50]SLL98792.1 cell division protein DivIVA [Actinoplanes sp. SE50/110]
MPLTPADIHNVAFKKPPIGKRGYDEEEVDAFLDEVEQELIRLLEENNALRNQAQRGGGNPAATMVITNEFADLQAQLERLQEARARAEQNARNVQSQLERARSAAPSGAMPTIGDDDRNARVLMMAQRTADEHMRDAQRESESVMEGARAKAEQLTAEAQMKAGTIESDARRNHAEAMDSLVEKRAALVEEIDKLGQLASGYQQALTNHVTQQLMDLTSGPDAAE